jgi:ferredoxin
MVEIKISETGCRGCQLCVDICPTETLLYDEPTKQAKVQETEDCITCLSCIYLCPSGAIALSGHHAVKNFYRDINFSKRVEKFL